MAMATLSASGLCALLCLAAAAQTKDKIFAQKIAEETRGKHPEVSGIESSTSGFPQVRHNHFDLNEKCDNEGLEPMRTGKPFSEHEKDGLDVTMPLRSAKGEIVGSVRMDCKPEPKQTQSHCGQAGGEIAGELASRIPDKATLFERAK